MLFRELIFAHKVYAFFAHNTRAIGAFAEVCEHIRKFYVIFYAGNKSCAAALKLISKNIYVAVFLYNRLFLLVIKNIKRSNLFFQLRCHIKRSMRHTERLEKALFKVFAELFARGNLYNRADNVETQAIRKFFAGVEEQPALARRMVDERSTLCAEFTERFKDTPVRRIILFGSGSSNHAARMAKPILERALGVEVTPIVPTRISELDHVPEDGLFWFAISQSGISTNTYHLIRNLQAKGIPVTAITGGHDTPIAQCADCSVELPCGEENIGAKTKGQVASALALILLGLEWGRVRGTCDAQRSDERESPPFFRMVRHGSSFSCTRSSPLRAQQGKCTGRCNGGNAQTA